MNKSIAITIACFLFIGILAFLVVSTCLYWTKQDDYNKAWQNGYDTALSAKSEYEETIKQLQAEKLNLSTELADTKASVESLTASNESFKTQVTELTEQKQALQNSVEDLTQTKTENELTISTLQTKVSSYETQISDLQDDVTEYTEEIQSLNTQIANLNSEIEKLENDVANNTAEIAELQQQKLGLKNQITNLNSQIATKTQEINTLNSNIISLNNLVSKLQNTNNLQVQTISNLNTQIVSLNTQISNLTLQINNNSGLVSTLNQKITQLENSITYYEEYIAGLENGDQIVITVEFNGSVYNVQVINKGGKVSLVEPTSTDYVIFNYWQLENGTQIDLSTYAFDESTKIIANVTCKYDVDFYVDNASVDDQIIVANGYATAPSIPSKSGYEFDGWSLDGSTVIDVSSYTITKNTIFYAVFTKLHTVQFNDGTQVIDTQIVRNGEYADNVNIQDTPYIIFNGWTVGGSLVDIDSYTISSDIIFTANFTYKYDVKFMDGETLVNTQIVANNEMPTAVIAPTKSGYRFLGWSIDGENIVDPTSIAISGTTIYTAMYVQQFMVTFYDAKYGGIVSTKLVDKDSIIGVLDFNLPTKEHYEFKHWAYTDILTEVVFDPTSCVITKNLNVYAVWEQLEFSITFTTEPYGAGELVAQKFVQKNGILGELDFDAPTKEHYVFKNWAYIDRLVVKVFDPTSYVVTNNLNVYAVWEQVEFTVSFYASESELISTEVVAKNSNLQSVPTVQTPTNKVFVGWAQKGYDDRFSNDEMSVKTFNSDVIYYAYFANVFEGRFSTEDGKYVITIVNGKYGNDSEVITDTPIFKCGINYTKYIGLTVEIFENSWGYEFISNIYNERLVYDKISDCWLYTFTNKSGESPVSQTYTLSRVKAPYTSYILD